MSEPAEPGGAMNERPSKNVLLPSEYKRGIIHNAVDPRRTSMAVSISIFPRYPIAWAMLPFAVFYYALLLVMGRFAAPVRQPDLRLIKGGQLPAVHRTSS
jgi:hypothetical protein